MLADDLVDAFRARVDALGFDLADLRIGGTAQRPLVQVRIDVVPGGSSARGVTVGECATVSRALEAWLDADGGPLGNRYILEVSSPGLERPLRWPRHWAQFVGREITAKVPGWGRVRARIVAMPDEASVVLEPKDGTGGGAARTVPLAEIKDARLAVDW